MKRYIKRFLKSFLNEKHNKEQSKKIRDMEGVLGSMILRANMQDSKMKELGQIVYELQEEASEALSHFDDRLMMLEKQKGVMHTTQH